MKNKISIILFLIIIFSSFMFLYFSVIEKKHKCINDNCQICAEIYLCKQINKNKTSILNMRDIVLFNLKNFVNNKNNIKNEINIKNTLISLKVEMLN